MTKSNIFKLLTNRLGEVNNIGLKRIIEKNKIENVKTEQKINLIVITSF